jgi:hypothetical protein
MKTTNYHLVSNLQVIFLTIISSLMMSSCVLAFMALKQYLELPKVIVSADKKCVQVISFKNGETFTCGDLDMSLRNYRIEQK